MNLEQSVLPRKGQFGYDRRANVMTPRVCQVLGGMDAGKRKDRKAKLRQQIVKATVDLFQNQLSQCFLCPFSEVCKQGRSKESSEFLGGVNSLGYLAHAQSLALLQKFFTVLQESRGYICLPIDLRVASTAFLSHHFCVAS